MKPRMKPRMTERTEETEEDEGDDDDDERDKKDKKDKNKSSLCDEEVFKKFDDMLKELPEEDKNNDVMKSIIKDIKSKEKDFNKKNKKKNLKQRTKNAAKLKKLLSEKKTLNDIKFFKDNCVFSFKNWY